MTIRSIVSLAAAAILASVDGSVPSQVAGAAVAETPTAAVQEEAPYVPTRQETVEEMLRMAKVSRDDVVYDLGSGDGRIVITAAKDYGARGVGIDVDPRLIAEAIHNARSAGVTDRVRFIHGDLFDLDLRDATAVMLYLLPSVNVRLRPKLLAELRPGTPVVSHDFDMGEWEPEDKKQVAGDELYLWIIPARVDGAWSWTTPDGQRRTAMLRQEFQKFDGELEGEGDLALRNGRLHGQEVTFELTRGGTGELAVVERYRGRVNGRTITGTAEAGGRRWEWRAQHE